MLADCDKIRLMRKGILKTNSVHLQPHEFHTVYVLLEYGFDIELVRAANIKGIQMPDIILDGIPWEIKAPIGGSKNTIKHNIQNAAHQSENVIFDLCRCKLDEDKALSEIKYHYNLSKHIKRLKVITKSEKIIDIPKQKGVL